MGDMELDAMDSMDYGDDYESGVPENEEHVQDSTERTMDETDAVAALLRGEDIGDFKSKGNDSGVRTRDIDGHGRVDYSRGESKAEAPVQQETEYGISGFQTTQAIDHHQAEVDQANAAYQKLTAMYQSGEIDDTTFQHYANIAGNHAGMHQRQLYESQLAQRDHADQQRQAYAYLEQQFPGQFTEETRKETLNSVVDWMTKDQGLDPSYLMDVEDPRIISTAMNAMNAIKTNDELKDTVAQLKSQVRRLKGQRTKGRKQGQRASQAGVRGDKQDAMLDEVVQLLNGGSSKGGR